MILSSKNKEYIQGRTIQEGECMFASDSFHSEDGRTTFDYIDGSYQLVNNGKVIMTDECKDKVLDEYIRIMMNRYCLE